ncbi:HVO_A0556 family zinc finger protein [Haloterrigena salinisoli]|uniref:HVO_A0556 family zinc finger protein n=1 Tax=Haloterrigena salinisoli TaxID=3132747 RepID=UPI0030D37C52
MQESVGANVATHPVVDSLEGTSCTFCDDGELERGVYKGKTAVICDSCETPGAQLW